MRRKEESQARFQGMWVYPTPFKLIHNFKRNCCYNLASRVIYRLDLNLYPQKEPGLKLYFFLGAGAGGGGSAGWCLADHPTWELTSTAQGHKLPFLYSFLMVVGKAEQQYYGLWGKWCPTSPGCLCIFDITPPVCPPNILSHGRTQCFSSLPPNQPSSPTLVFFFVTYLQRMLSNNPFPIAVEKLLF